MNAKALGWGALLAALSLPALAASGGLQPYDADTGRSAAPSDSRIDRPAERANNADRDSSMGSYLRDSEITARVKAKLASERLGSLTSISVDTDRNGVVTLSGQANSPEEAKKAEAIARNVPGVSGVENHITVASNE